jgi:two-component system cell cycle sensor histidine kinase/response regulator CckA
VKRAAAGTRKVSSAGVIPEAAVEMLVGVVPDAMIVVDRERRIVAANRQAERLFGYDAKELIGELLDVLVPDRFKVSHPRQMKEYVKHPRSRPMGNGLKLEGRRKDGTVFPVDISLGTLRTERGPLTAAAVRDITPAEASYRGLVEASIQGILVHQDGVVQFANPALVAMLGYAGAGELVGRQVDDLVAPEDRARIIAAREAWLCGAEPAVRYETRMLPKDRVPRWFECISARTSWDGAPATLITMVDISERRRAEDALRLSDSILQNVANIVIVAGPDGGIRYASPSVKAVLGYEPQEVLGGGWWRLTWADPAEGERERQAVASAARGEVPPSPHSYERTIRTRDGAVRAMLWRDSTGPEGYLVGVGLDITDRRQLEEQYRQAQKMEAIGQLAGGVAHDFNNLLTAISGYTDLVREDLPPDDPRRQDLDEVQRAADRAAALTRQLLAFGRRQVLQPRVLDVNEIVRGMAKMLHRLIGEDVRLGTKLAGDLPGVRADPGRLEQVIMNLAINARDAMPGGGDLTIETSTVQLSQDYAASYPDVQPGRYVLLAISDSGEGMTEDVRAHVFEPFFTTKSPGRGTGLGLATVYGIMKQTGGHVAVYSEVGRGTTMKVYLPVADSVVEVGAAAVVEAPSPTGSETVLLVEDEDGVRKLARDVLVRYGYHVLLARDGAQAVALCHGHRGDIHLMVTDVVMPGMGGVESAELITQLRPGIKVLFMSGYADRAVTEHRVLDPGARYLQKPFTPAVLARKVREALDG